MSDISSSAAAARESARQSSGRFGHQKHSETSDVQLPSTSRPSCPRCGGAWGHDETCGRCCYEDGSTRPLALPGPLGAAAWGGTPPAAGNVVLWHDPGRSYDQPAVLATVVETCESDDGELFGDEVVVIRTPSHLAEVPLGELEPGDGDAPCRTCIWYGMQYCRETVATCPNCGNRGDVYALMAYASDDDFEGTPQETLCLGCMAAGAHLAAAHE